MHPLAVGTRPRLPVRHRALVKAEGHHNRLQWAAAAQQRHHNRHHLCIRTQAVEGRALTLTKCLATQVTAVTPLLEAVDPDIAFAPLPTCRTGRVRAKY